VTPPPTAGSSISRTSTSSAASATYRAHRCPHVREASEGAERHVADSFHASSANDQSTEERTVISEERTEKETCPKCSQASRNRLQGAMYSWLNLFNPFKRQRASPPPEVSLAMATIDQNTSVTEHNGPLSRESAPNRPHRALWRKKNNKGDEIPLPVTIIPWQPRGRACLDSIVDDAPASSGSAEPVRHLATLPTSEGTQSMRRSVTPLRDTSSFAPLMESMASPLATPRHVFNSDIMSAQQAPFLEQQHSKPTGSGSFGLGSAPEQ